MRENVVVGLKVLAHMTLISMYADVTVYVKFPCIVVVKPFDLHHCGSDANAIHMPVVCGRPLQH